MPHTCKCMQMKKIVTWSSEFKPKLSLLRMTYLIVCITMKTSGVFPSFFSISKRASITFHSRYISLEGKTWTLTYYIEEKVNLKQSLHTHIYIWKPMYLMRQNRNIRHVKAPPHFWGLHKHEMLHDIRLVAYSKIPHAYYNNQQWASCIAPLQRHPSSRCQQRGWILQPTSILWTAQQTQESSHKKKILEKTNQQCERTKIVINR